MRSPRMWARPARTPQLAAGQALRFRMPHLFSPRSARDVSYHAGGTTHSIRAVRTDTNFVRLRSAFRRPPRSVRPGRAASSRCTCQRASAPVPSAGKTFDSGVNGRSTLSGGQLSGCVANVAGTQNVLLVELATYEGHPATIIVLASAQHRSAEVWVVSDSLLGKRSARSCPPQSGPHVGLPPASTGPAGESPGPAGG